MSAYDPAVGKVVYKRNSDAAISSITRQRDSLQSVLKNYGYDGLRSPKKKFIIGEINVPRKPLGDMNFGSDDIQKNFIIKSYVTAATNGIAQMNIKSISEESTLSEANDGSQVMGLYQKLTSTPYNRTANIEGFAFKTVSEILFGLTYDSVRTRLLNLPLTVRGAAFKNKAEKYTYVLWAKATDDLSEWGSSLFSFPNSLSINRLYKREWSFCEDRRATSITTQNIPLSITPIFLSEDSLLTQPPVASFGSDTRKTCPPLTVKFSENAADATSYLWRFDGGTPAVSTEKNPSVVYRQSGKYDVALEVRNTQGVHTNRKIEYVEVSSAPKADFTWVRDSNGLFIRFQSTTTGSFTMIWDFGDGLSDFSLSPTHRYLERKIYSIRLIAINECGRDTILRNIDLRPNGINDPSQIIDFQCFPNPFDDNITVQYYLTEKSNVDIELFDVAGKLVQILVKNAVYTEGGYRSTYQVVDMPKGVYLLKLKTDKQAVYTKVVKF